MTRRWALFDRLGVRLAFVLAVALLPLLLLALLVLSEGHFSATLLPWLLLLNPADIYRLINLSGFEGESGGLGVLSLGSELPFPSELLGLCLLLWVGVSLWLAYAVFRRRSL